MTAAKPRFERHEADVRRKALVDATIESLKRHGHEGLSVRRISAEAGVSIGLINHHFPNKNALVAEAYRHFNSQLIEGIRAAVERAADSPRERLHALFRATFSPPNLDRDVLAVWIVLWGCTTTPLKFRLFTMKPMGATWLCYAKSWVACRKRTVG